MAEVASGGPRLPEDLVIWEILTRLPAKPLLRCCAVCRSWRRRLTSDAKFLLAHHRRQPSLPLLTSWDTDTHERRIDALDHRTGERHPIARRTPCPTAANEDEDDILVFASCDGLIILHAYGGLEICNPATRQRAPLTLLQGAACISALYPHRPSGSYRVLCCFTRAEDGHAVYYVHTVGSGELRCVGEPPAPWASGDLAMAVSMMGFHDPPVLADGRIYWDPIALLGGNDNDKANNMLAFDTVAESFQHLLSPVGVESPFVKLFQMNSGALGLYHHRGSSGTADLWVLQDHGSWSWSMNHRLKLDVRFFALLWCWIQKEMCLSVLKEGDPQASCGNICGTFLVLMAVCWPAMNGALIRSLAVIGSKKVLSTMTSSRWKVMLVVWMKNHCSMACQLWRWFVMILLSHIEKQRYY